jgi:predicted kinase
MALPAPRAIFYVAVVGTAYVVVGSTGAGKSTLARTLARELGAPRFAIDDWMTALFVPDRPADAGFTWYSSRIERCLGLIWELALQTLELDRPVVFEIGLTLKAERAAFRDKVRAAGHTFSLRVVEADAAARWQRVEQRNRERGDTFAFEVTREMFDFVESMWEPPDDAELEELAAVRIRTDGATRGR